MKIEEISKVEILENGEMYLILASGGDSTYQYIYRETAEVYWDKDKKGFKAPSPRKWSYSDWFLHILTVLASVETSLKLTESTCWVNVPAETKKEIFSKVEHLTSA